MRARARAREREREREASLSPRVICSKPWRTSSSLSFLSLGLAGWRIWRKEDGQISGTEVLENLKLVLLSTRKPEISGTTVIEKMEDHVERLLDDA